MNDVTQKLQANMYMPEHLSILEKLLNRKFEKSDLLSAEETEVIRQKSIHTWDKYPQHVFEIEFEERKSPKFQKFIETLAKAATQDVYLWLPHTKSCGLNKPVKLLAINFAFEFDWIKEGLFSIVTADGANRLTLDFSEDGGEYLLELEIRGREWSQISY